MTADGLKHVALLGCCLALACSGIVGDLEPGPSPLVTPVADAGHSLDAGTVVRLDAGGPVDAGGASDAGERTCADPAPLEQVAGPQWVNATGNLAGMASDCANLSRGAAVPCSPTVIVSVANAGLWATDDRGATWRQLGRAPGSAAITNRGSAIIFDPVHPSTFWETGLYGGGIYKTSNAGDSFDLLGPQSFTQWVSVDFGDPSRKTLLTGTHGQRQQVQLSRDQGATWTNVGANLPADSDNSEFPVILDAHTFLVGGSSGAATCGIFRSTDTGASWQRVSTLSVSHFGAPLRASDGAIYWPLHSDAGLAKSVDGGLTWTVVVGPGVMAGVTPLELPDHSIVVAGVDHLLRSTDGAVTWVPLGEPLPFDLTAHNDQGGLTYSAHWKMFFLWHWDCGSTVLPDAVMSAGYDPEPK
jgi:hypothetical protein